MPQVGALRVQQLLIDRIVEREIMLLNCIPKLCAVFLTQKHDSLSSSGAQIIGFFDTVPEEIVHDSVLGVKSDELLCRII